MFVEGKYSYKYKLHNKKLTKLYPVPSKLGSISGA